MAAGESGVQGRPLPHLDCLCCHSKEFFCRAGAPVARQRSRAARSGLGDSGGWALGRRGMPWAAVLQGHPLKRPSLQAGGQLAVMPGGSRPTGMGTALLGSRPGGGTPPPCQARTSRLSSPAGMTRLGPAESLGRVLCLHQGIHHHQGMRKGCPAGTGGGESRHTQLCSRSHVWGEFSGSTLCRILL